MPKFWAEINKERLPRDSLVSLIEAEPFDFEPGTSAIYNNSAYFLLGLVIEKMSGMTYQEFLQERLFDSVGLEQTYYCSESAIHAGKAHGYDLGSHGLVQRAYFDHTWPYSAGSLCSTTGDLVRWNQALHGGKVLSPESYQLMITPAPLLDCTELEYGMGLWISDRDGTRVITHGGGINGFLTHNSYFPDKELTVAILQNTASDRSPDLLAAKILDLVLGPVPEEEPTPYLGDLNTLVGEYAGPARGTHQHLTVSRDGDQLVLTPRSQGESERPRHVGDGIWVNGDVRYTFDVVGDRAIELVVTAYGLSSQLRRVQ